MRKVYEEEVPVRRLEDPGHDPVVTEDEAQGEVASVQPQLLEGEAPAAAAAEPLVVEALGPSDRICAPCRMVFKKPYLLRRHMLTHTGEKPYKCNQCAQSFSQAGNLSQHKRTHTDSKPFVCSDCDRGFRNKSDLVRHSRTHTGEKPYACESCGAAFRNSGNLRVHERSEHLNN